MFEIAFYGTLAQKYALVWMKFITIFCCANALILFFYHSNKFMLFTLLFPFFNCAIVDLIIIFFILFNLKKITNNRSAKYIKEEYPGIWKKLHPAGVYSYTFTTFWAFVRGKYDNGFDERLNLIKSNEKEKLRFIIWVNLLTPVFWAINLIIYRISV